jgi:hypothetical protein
VVPFVPDAPSAAAPEDFGDVCVSKLPEPPATGSGGTAAEVGDDGQGGGG